MRGDCCATGYFANLFTTRRRPAMGTLFVPTAVHVHTQMGDVAGWHTSNGEMWDFPATPVPQDWPSCAGQSLSLRGFRELSCPKTGWLPRNQGSELCNATIADIKHCEDELHLISKNAVGPLSTISASMTLTSLFRLSFCCPACSVTLSSAVLLRWLSPALGGCCGHRWVSKGGEGLEMSRV